MSRSWRGTRRGNGNGTNSGIGAWRGGLAGFEDWQANPNLLKFFQHFVQNLNFPNPQKNCASLHTILSYARQDTILGLYRICTQLHMIQAILLQAVRKCRRLFAIRHFFFDWSSVVVHPPPQSATKSARPLLSAPNLT